jgi:hypothetical protein
MFPRQQLDITIMGRCVFYAVLAEIYSGELRYGHTERYVRNSVCPVTLSIEGDMFMFV